MSNNRQVSSSSFFSAGVTTTISISLVLFLLGLILFTIIIGRELSAYIKENISISIELSSDTSQSSINKLQKQLQESPFIKSVIYISQEEVRQNLIEDLGGDPEEVLGYIPSSSYIDLKLKSEYANPDSIKKVEASLKNYNIVKDVIFNAETVETINTNLSKIGFVLFLISLVLMFISFTLINNTIRLHIYSQRFIINTMQLVGATNRFIRHPFVLRALGYGTLAAIIANIGITGLIYFLTKDFPDLIEVIKIQNLLFIYIIVLILGLTLAFAATTLSVNKYLRMKTNNLYYV